MSRIEATARKHSASYKMRKFGLASTSKKIYTATASLIITSKQAVKLVFADLNRI